MKNIISHNYSFLSIAIVIVSIVSCSKSNSDLYDVQKRLDDGESISDILVHNPDNRFLGKYWAEGGGYIIWLSVSSKEILIAAPEDLDNEAWWGNNDIYDATFELNNEGDGAANSTAIDNMCGWDNIAANYCLEFEQGGFDDWYLPCDGEMSRANEVLYKNGIGNLVGGEKYWTSNKTEEAEEWEAVAFIFNSASGSTSNTSVINFLRVRPMRFDVF